MRHDRITTKPIQPFAVVSRLVVVWACFLVMACQSQPQVTGFTAPATAILSGQELEVGGVPKNAALTERVRLEGIQAPRLNQVPWGQAAQAALQQVLNQHPVLIESDVESRNENGQRLVYLWQDGRLINEFLVSEGYALAKPHPPNNRYDRRLSHAQERARILGLGIWNPANPMR